MVRARRLPVLLAVVLFLTGVFFLYQRPMPGQTQPFRVIELTGNVEAEKCAPCHLRIAEAQTPGLVFTHGNHLMIGCFACHYKDPHRDGADARPPMDSCFNCHGILHGPEGELATKECEDCHTPSFVLRPASHVPDWAEAPHAEASKDDANRCMMCHEPAGDCDPCHLDEGVELEPLSGVYRAVFSVEPEQPAIQVFPQERVTMGQCVHCHPDVDDFMPGRIIFGHADHLGRSYPCDSCHVAFPHDNERITVPSMAGCYRCHGLTHAAGGLVAREECSACHPPEFELRPEDHTDEWVAGDHKDPAKEDGAYCAMCHAEEFCIECHQGERVGPDDEPIAKVIPADHLVAEWYGEHGDTFLEQTGMCGACHESDSCTTCHQTSMPHPTDWLEVHGQQEEPESDCDICHADRNRCQACHHATLTSNELVEPNCTPCHEEMKHKPATEIKHKSFAEHAVHFDVEEIKGRPYECLDCHVGFGPRREIWGSDTPESHDLRTCYLCHGALDYRRIEIAPYPGRELCVRCHVDLNI